jgi:hypothetical protein
MQAPGWLQPDASLEGAATPFEAIARQLPGDLGKLIGLSLQQELDPAQAAPLLGLSPNGLPSSPSVAGSTAQRSALTRWMY